MGSPEGGGGSDLPQEGSLDGDRPSSSLPLGSPALPDLGQRVEEVAGDHVPSSDSEGLLLSDADLAVDGEGGGAILRQRRGSVSGSHASGEEMLELRLERQLSRNPMHEVDSVVTAEGGPATDATEPAPLGAAIERSQRASSQLAAAKPSSGGATKKARDEVAHTLATKPGVGPREQRRRLERMVLLPITMAYLLGAHPLLEVVEQRSQDSTFARGTYTGIKGVFIYLGISICTHLLLILTLYLLLWLVRVGPNWLRRRQALAVISRPRREEGTGAPMTVLALRSTSAETIAEREARMLIRQKAVERAQAQISLLMHSFADRRKSVNVARSDTSMPRSEAGSDVGGREHDQVVARAMPRRVDVTHHAGDEPSLALRRQALNRPPAAIKPRPAQDIDFVEGDAVPLGIMRMYGDSDADGAVRTTIQRTRHGSSNKLRRLTEAMPAAAAPLASRAGGGGRIPHSETMTSLPRPSAPRSPQPALRKHSRSLNELRLTFGFPPTAEGNEAEPDGDGDGGDGEARKQLKAAAAVPEESSPLIRAIELVANSCVAALIACVSVPLALRPELLRGAWQLSRILRTIMWCALWVNATRYLTRDRPCNRTDYAKLALGCENPWDASAVPAWHYDLENLFLWMLTLEFAYELLCARDKLRFMCSFSTAVDLLTLPVLKLTLWIVAEPFFNANASSFLLQFGWLRFLRLHGLQPIFKEAFGNALSTTTLRVVSIMLGLLSLNLAFAGAVFNEEAPALHVYNPDDWSDFFAFVYYAWVTMSTLGYGDFAPLSPFSRALVILVVLLTLSWVPRQFGALSSALEEDRRQYGRLPAATDAPHILLCGPVTVEQLRHFLSTFLELGGESEERTKVLVLTPHPAQFYHPERLIAELNVPSGRLCLRQGDVTSTRAEDLIEAVAGAKAVFVASDVSTQAMRARADLQTVTRCLGVRKFMQAAAELSQEDESPNSLAKKRPAAGSELTSMYVQSHFTTNRLILTGMGVAHQIYLSSLKMRVLGRAATSCQGCATITSVLLYAPKVGGNNDANDAAGAFQAWRLKYHQGLDYQVYRVTLPAEADGYTFAEVSLILYELFNVILLSISTKSAQGAKGYLHITQRSRRITGGRTEGFVLAQSKALLEQNLRALAATGMPFGRRVFPAQPPRAEPSPSPAPPPEPAGATTPGASAEREAAAVAAASARKAAAARPTVRAPSSVDVHDLRPWLHARTKRIAERFERYAAERASPPPVAASPSAGLSALAEAPAPPAVQQAPCAASHGPSHILISGWARDTAVLLETIFSSEPAASVAILTTHVPDHEAACLMLSRWPRTFLIHGTVHVSSDLLRAGLLEARTVLLLGMPESYEKQQRSAGAGATSKFGLQPHATNELLPTDAAQALATTKVSILRLRAELERAARAAKREAREPSDEAAAEPTVAVARNMRVITEVMEVAAIPFVDQSGWWPLDNKLGAHLDSPAFAAGDVFADSLFFPLLCQLYFVPELLALLEALLIPTEGHAFMQLIDPPAELVGLPFGAVFERLLGFQPDAARPPAPPPAERDDEGAQLGASAFFSLADDGAFAPVTTEEQIDAGVLVIGLYKRRSARHRYVFLVPKHDDLVEPGDKLYVIGRRHFDALAHELAVAADEVDDSELCNSVAPLGNAATAVRDQAERAQAEVGASDLELLKREVLAMRTQMHTFMTTANAVLRASQAAVPVVPTPIVLSEGAPSPLASPRAATPLPDGVATAPLRRQRTSQGLQSVGSQPVFTDVLPPSARRQPSADQLLQGFRPMTPTPPTQPPRAATVAEPGSATGRIAS